MFQRDSLSDPDSGPTQGSDAMPRMLRRARTAGGGGVGGVELEVERSL